MDRDAKIVKLKLDVIFKRVFGNEQNEKMTTIIFSKK